MKTVLLLVLLNTDLGSRTTIEYPMKDFGTCLEKKKEMAQSELPPEYKVQKFECIVGAE